MKSKHPAARNQRMYHEVSAKLNAGPGGLHCMCCSPGNFHHKAGKQFLHRVYRRVTKYLLKKTYTHTLDFETGKITSEEN